MPREQKITFGQMRESGAHGVVVFCSDYHCSHSTRLPADRWPDDVRLSDIEPQFVCRRAASAAQNSKSLPLSVAAFSGTDNNIPLNGIKLPWNYIGRKELVPWKISRRRPVESARKSFRW
jgi:hypothetical protein